MLRGWIRHRRQTPSDWLTTILAIGVFLGGAVAVDDTAWRVFGIVLAVYAAAAQTWLWTRGRRSQAPDEAYL